MQEIAVNLQPGPSASTRHIDSYTILVQYRNERLATEFISEVPVKTLLMSFRALRLRFVHHLNVHLVSIPKAKQHRQKIIKIRPVSEIYNNQSSHIVII